MVYILSWTTKKHQKTLSGLIHSKLKKIQGLFKDLHRQLRTFQDCANDKIPWVPEVFSRVRRGASSATRHHVFGRRPKTRAAKRLDRNRKPRMKSLWNPG